VGLSFDFLVYSREGRVDLQRPAALAGAEAIVRRLYPRSTYVHRQTGRLLDVCRQPRGFLAVGAFDDGVLIATKDAHLYAPDILHRRYLKLGEWTDVQLITSASVNNMFAYGRWRSGEITRSISVNAVAGVWRNFGSPSAFEDGMQVTPESWLELCNAALMSTLRLAGDGAVTHASSVDWDDVYLHVFGRA